LEIRDARKAIPGSQVLPPSVVACFNAAGSRVNRRPGTAGGDCVSRPEKGAKLDAKRKTRKHSSAFASQHAPLAESVVSGNACNDSVDKSISLIVDRVHLCFWFL
jgi:hypothetical protein